jgi:hypothetical protein
MPQGHSHEARELKLLLLNEEGVFSVMSMQQAQRQMPASAGRVAVADGEAVRATISDEACGPRHGFGNAGSALALS